VKLAIEAAVFDGGARLSGHGGQPIEVEIAVEVASKRHQRARVVVAIAIKRAIDRRLHRLFDRLRQVTKSGASAEPGTCSRRVE
jgi:hypothetical protein